MGSKRGSKKGVAKRFYPEEVKREVIRMKLSGDYTNAEIMEVHQIKSSSQIKTWMKWYRDGETNRLARHTGSSNSSVTELSEVEELKKKILYYEMKEELLGKYRELERRSNPSSL